MKPLAVGENNPADYAIHPNGGIVGRTMRPFSQPITIRAHVGQTSGGEWIEFSQGGDSVMVSEAQLQWVLDAITRAAKHLKWAEYL